MSTERGKNCATGRPPRRGIALARAEAMMLSEERTDDGVVLRIVGTLDALTAPEVRPKLEEIAANGHQRVTVDLSEVDLIDSSGVAMLVSLYKQVSAQRGEVLLHGVKDQPLAVLRLLRLDRVFAL